VLAEYGDGGLYEPIDLGIARCRLMTATRKDYVPSGQRLRVATKYVKLAQRYFAGQGVQSEIIKLYGSMELAPLVGLADVIVDLVDTGNTLKANGLEAREEIMAVSSRLGGNKAAMKTKHQGGREFLCRVEQVVLGRGGRGFRPSPGGVLFGGAR
jgi:ATP phosphoribosyltransferase